MTVPASTIAASDRPLWIQRFHFAEDAVNLWLLLLMGILPVMEIVGRMFSKTLPGSAQYVQLLTLTAGFFGAVLATREARQLSLATGLPLFSGRTKEVVDAFASLVSVVVTVVLTWGAWEAVMADRGLTDVLPGNIPAWIAQLPMPIAYGLIAWRFLLLSSSRHWVKGLLLALAVGVVWLLQGFDYEVAEQLRWPLLVVVLGASVLGAPIFVVLGGVALVLFWADDVTVAAVGAETVRQINSPVMPTIPLFTLAGYILAESKASERLVRVFRALVGWLPGGMAVMAAIVCAFFTTFTGASGVTILALGGLLFAILKQDKYPETFRVGLITASGSIGLMFPPSLPVILYGVTAHVPIDRMFVAAFLPGLVLVLAVCFLSVREGLRDKMPRATFSWRECVDAAWVAKWELGLPVLVLSGIFLGFTTLVEAAALTAMYALFIEIFVYKDIKVGRDLVRIGRECAVLVGGVLVILGVALGLTSYMVDAEIPSQALDWVKGSISSKYVFLFALNVLLLVVGCLMDIFSAIVVVVPLILPIAAHFEIEPVHLGVIFLANLELGFMTPPVGMNLFLASYRFEKPLAAVYRASFPFLLVLLVAVLIVTYVPALTTWPVEWIFGHLPKPPPIQF
jgi:C4-dicarboxylate transporter, DctM subunit